MFPIIKQIEDDASVSKKNPDDIIAGQEVNHFFRSYKMNQLQNSFDVDFKHRITE